MSSFLRNSAERRGIIVLVVLLFGITIANFFYTSGGHIETREEAAQRKDSTVKPKHAPRYYAQTERKVETFDFDPNTADSTTFLSLGLTPSMVRGIYKYRAMGYVYSTVEDFSRVPGMTQGMWQRLSPHVRIAERFRPMTPLERPRPTTRQAETSETRQANTPADTSFSRPVATLRQPKLRAGETIEINTADTTQLKTIPGIGSHFASRIVRYREQLGGFADLSQLDEIDAFPLEALPYMHIDTQQIRRINVNHCTRNDLMRHPYLRAYRARAIWDYRHNIGPLRSISDLRLLPDFTEEDLRRLQPYLLFR